LSICQRIGKYKNIEYSMKYVLIIGNIFMNIHILQNMWAIRVKNKKEYLRFIQGVIYIPGDP